MEKHPSLHFIRYLMTTPGPDALDDGWVAFQVSQLGLPRTVPAFLLKTRADLMAKLPPNFQPTNRYHRDSTKFLRSNGIYSMHHPDEGVKGALLILTNLQARPVIEQLLLGRIETKDISKKVNARFSEFFTTGAIETYKHYYWNVDLLKVEDWASLFEDYEKFRDSRVRSILQVGPAMALHVSGFQQQIESKTVLRELMDTIYFDLKDWKNAPRSEEKTRALTALAKAAVGLDVQLSQADSALKEQLKAFEQFRMKHAVGTVEDIRNLAPDGNYTLSGARLLEAAPLAEEGEPK